ncbi:MAG: HAMP domain-containing sensor histidine kinase [Victivallales bacterium]|nr:HAMP domain-containing sensor histidine kinase [Victivallales bacterium]
MKNEAKMKLRKKLLLTAVLLSGLVSFMVCLLFTVMVREEARQRMTATAELLAASLESGTVSTATMGRYLTARGFRFIVFTRFHNGGFEPIYKTAFPEDYVRFLPQPDGAMTELDASRAAPEYFTPAIRHEHLMAVMVPLSFRNRPAFAAIGMPEPRLPWYRYGYLVVLCCLPLSVLLPAVMLSPGAATEAAAPERRPVAAGQVVPLGRLAALGQVITGIIHEINQPLCIIKGYLGLLQMAGEEGEQKSEGEDTTAKYLEICLQNMDRTEATLEHLRKFVRDGGRECREVELNALITNIIDFFGEQFHQRSIRLEIKLPEVSPRLKIAAVLLEQTLINLLANARDSFACAGENGYENVVRQITVTVTATGSEVRIDVADNGRGMTPEVLAHCIEPFYSTQAGKAGVGLAMSREVAERFGGKLKLRSVERRGTTASLIFPVPPDANSAATGGEHAVA